MLDRQIQYPLHALSVELFVLNLNAKAVETGLNQGQIGEGAAAAQGGHGNQFLLVSKPQTLSGHAAISTHQTARAQLDAPKPANDQHRDAVAILPFYGLQNGAPGCAAGFTIIVKTVFRPDLVGPAIMRGIGHTLGLKEGQSLAGTVYRSSQCQKTAFFDVLLEAGGLTQGKDGHPWPQSCSRLAR